SPSRMPWRSRRVLKLWQLVYTLATILYIQIAEKILLQSSTPCRGQQWKALGILGSSYWHLLFISGNTKSLGSAQRLEYPLRTLGVAIKAMRSIVVNVERALKDAKVLNSLK